MTGKYSSGSGLSTFSTLRNASSDLTFVCLPPPSLPLNRCQSLPFSYCKWGEQYEEVQFIGISSSLSLLHCVKLPALTICSFVLQGGHPNMIQISWIYDGLFGLHGSAIGQVAGAEDSLWLLLVLWISLNEKPRTKCHQWWWQEASGVDKETSLRNIFI